MTTNKFPYSSKINKIIFNYYFVNNLNVVIKVIKQNFTCYKNHYIMRFYLNVLTDI